MTWLRPWLVVILVLIGANVVVADDNGLTLADLETYRQALEARPDPSAPRVKFRDLWDRPEASLGKVVQVEGKVARLFRQGRLGEFPPLVEAWVVSTAGDPFCLVFPDLAGQPSPEIGASVRFSGTFLKRIKYQGGDTSRLAPLLVGPRSPWSASPAVNSEGSSWSPTDWMLAVGGLAVVVMILVGRHLSRPLARPSRLEPPPVFWDGDSRPAFDDHDGDEPEEAR